MIDPVAFSILGLKIHWYGISYVLGFIFVYFFTIHFSKEFGIKKEIVEDIFLYVMIFSVLGGRLFEILFYNLHFYLNNPLEIVAIWNGGMSIHGGFFGSAIAFYYCSKKYKISFFRISDLFILPAGFALAFGRFANFINQELVGIKTNSYLGLVFPLYDDNIRYPYQLIASFKNLIVFQILLYLYFFKKLKFGMITAWFLILYNFLRFLIDFIRVPSQEIFGIPVEQILNLIFMFIGILILKKI